MHGHKGFHQFDEQAGSGPDDDRFDRLADLARARGRRRGRPDRFARHFGFGPGFGGPGFGGQGFGRGPRAGRGDVRAAILALLAEEPMHGYQVITEITERSGGVWRPSPGSVYPTLQALEDQGLVTADQSEGRRVFSLTGGGRAEAEAAGDGPPPWEEAAQSADRSLVDLKSLLGETAAAIWQVARAGNQEQIKAVAEILADTRRRIYLILADGRSAPATPTGPSSEPQGG
ncbi:MAG: PadR family transcriptional regulator [Acidimicrobiales bacterium]